MSDLHRRVAGRLARHAGIRVYRFFARDLDDGRVPPACAGLDFRVMTEPEVLARANEPGLNLSPDKVRAALARGDVCAGAYDEGRLAGYCWFAYSPLPHLDGVWVSFGDEVGWTYKSLVRPSHRGRGIAPALYDFADRLGRQRGRKRAVICVESHNRASIAAARRSGHLPEGYAACLHRGQAVLSWCSPAVRRNGIRFYTPA